LLIQRWLDGFGAFKLTREENASLCFLGEEGGLISPQQIYEPVGFGLTGILYRVIIEGNASQRASAKNAIQS